MVDIDIVKNLGTFILDVKLNIQDNEFIAISGISGSGKTTFLRILAGLEKAKGDIKVNEKVWLSNNIDLPPQKRDIGFVFQDYALFPNMNVKQNLLYFNNDLKLMNRLLQITQLDELLERYPDNLSGGQKQRVALCRAMMQKPKLLLLDEPLSALDSTIRNILQTEILSLHKEFNLTTILVSHDPSEIYKLASRVVVLKDGNIVQQGTPSEVFLHTQGSQKFSFYGEVLEIVKTDTIYIATVAIGQQIVQIVLSKGEVEKLSVGDMINISTKAFEPTINL